MSLYDYRKSLEISKDDPSFAALIMAAMRKADSDNYCALVTQFPQIGYEMRNRHNASGGLLEKERLEGRVVRKST